MTFEDKQLADLPRDKLVEMLRTVRTLAWIGYADGRTIDDKNRALHAVQVATRLVGNEPPTQPPA